MSPISFWTIFVLFGIVSRWAEKALEDGKITLTEAAELAEDLGPVLGIPVEIEIPALPPPRVETAESVEVIDKTLQIDEEPSIPDIPPER